MGHTNKNDVINTGCVEWTLSMFTKAQQDLDAANNELKFCDDKTQDIMHELELVDHTYHERGRLTTELVTIRKRRRIAKDTIETLLPLTTWILNNTKPVNALKGVLGEMRKIDDKHADRMYYKRTDEKGKAIK